MTDDQRRYLEELLQQEWFQAVLQHIVEMEAADAVEIMRQSINSGNLNSASRSEGALQFIEELPTILGIYAKPRV